MAVIVRTFVVTGRVQGVGYRYYAQKVALSLKLTGWVRNLPSGSVECLGGVASINYHAHADHPERAESAKVGYVSEVYRRSAVRPC